MRYKILFIQLFLAICWSCFANSKAVVITCASGELGSAAAKVLAPDHHLILTGRDLSKLQQLQSELKADHPWNYEIFPLDYTNSSSIAQFNDRLKQMAFPISGLVLITPRPQFYGKALLQEEQAWLDVFQSTFTGPLEALKTVLPHLQNPSKIVIIAGTTSVQFQPEVGPACVIRRMWTTYTKALAHQLGPQGISVNALSPGVVLTAFHQERIQKKAQENGIGYEDQMEQETSTIPLRRHAKPQEAAQTIRFLLSGESDFINGINLLLDGGYTVSY